MATTLIAEEGMMLTDGTNFGKIIYLGKNDNPDNYWEITEQEYMAIVTQAPIESVEEVIE